MSESLRRTYAALDQNTGLEYAMCARSATKAGATLLAVLGTPRPSESEETEEVIIMRLTGKQVRDHKLDNVQGIVLLTEDSIIGKLLSEQSGIADKIEGSDVVAHSNIPMGPEECAL